MTSEWMKIMLDEIARKKIETKETLAELERRRREQQASPSTDTSGTVASGTMPFETTPPGTTPGGRPPQ